MDFVLKGRLHSAGADKKKHIASKPQWSVIRMRSRVFLQESGHGGGTFLVIVKITFNG